MHKEVTTNSLVTIDDALVCKYCQNNIEDIKVFLQTRVFPNLWNEELLLLPHLPMGQMFAKNNHQQLMIAILIAILNNTI